MARKPVSATTRETARELAELLDLVKEQTNSPMDIKVRTHRSIIEPSDYEIMPPTETEVQLARGQIHVYPEGNMSNYGQQINRLGRMLRQYGITVTRGTQEYPYISKEGGGAYQDGPGRYSIASEDREGFYIDPNTQREAIRTALQVAKRRQSERQDGQRAWGAVGWSAGL